MNITLSHQKDIKTNLPALPQVFHANIPLLLSLAALAAFELFNFSTTTFTLYSLLGPAPQSTMAWSLILAFAFCSMDIAGILYLAGKSNPDFHFKGHEWIFIAWAIGSVSNLILTWWGLSTAIALQQVHAGLVIDADLLMNVLPGFLAILLSIMRILIIGALIHVFSVPQNDGLFPYEDIMESKLILPEPMDPPYDPERGSLVPTRGFISPVGNHKSDEPKYRHTPVRYKAW